MKDGAGQSWRWLAALKQRGDGFHRKEEAVAPGRKGNETEVFVKARGLVVDGVPDDGRGGRLCGDDREDMEAWSATPLLCQPDKRWRWLLCRRCDGLGLGVGLEDGVADVVLRARVNEST